MEGTAHGMYPPLATLLDRYARGKALEQGFYLSGDVFARDMETIMMKEWHFAGLSNEIPVPGDYVLFELLKESVIIVRGNDGEIRAFANVCRHRGSRLCLEPRGSVKRFTCPYHAWIYGLDGQLMNARLMGDDLDRGALGLKPVAVELFQGMVFVSFSSAPSSFARMRDEIGPLLEPFGLERTKVAHRARYPVRANWKLLIENYNECYHCAPAHPEYRRAHPTHMDADRVKPYNMAMEPRARELGISTDYVDRVGAQCPPGSVDYTFSRHSLYEGYATGSDDGRPVAPLLGSLAGYDQAASDVYVGILNPMLIYNDHVVIYRFIPVDRSNSIQEIIWLVRDDAEEGRDYDTKRLTWLWDVTTVADKLIIEKNQDGVNSRYYEPGPLAEMEIYTQRFIDDYLARLSGSLSNDQT